MTLDGVTSFSRIKMYEMPVLQSKLLAGFLYVMAENWKNLKVLTAFFTVFFCFVFFCFFFSFFFFFYVCVCVLKSK